MAAAASSGTNQHLTLDRSLLREIVGSCLGSPVSARSTASPGRSRRNRRTRRVSNRIETVSLGFPETIEPVVPPPPMVTMADSKPAVVSARSAEDETLAELVKTQEAIETGMLDLDATVKRLVSLSPNLASELTPLEPAPVEPIPAKVTAVELACRSNCASRPNRASRHSLPPLPRPPNRPPSGKSHRLTKGRSRTRLHSISKPPATVFGTLSLAIELHSAPIPPAVASRCSSCNPRQSSNHRRAPSRNLALVIKLLSAFERAALQRSSLNLGTALKRLQNTSHPL